MWIEAGSVLSDGEKKADKVSLVRPTRAGRARRAGSRRSTIFFLFFFLLHLLSHLALKLMKALNLIRRQNAAHLGANTGIQSDLICLSCRQCLCRSTHLRIAIGLAHYRAIERLTRLPQAPPCGQGFVFVVPPNLLHSRPLFGRQPDRLHQSPLQLLLFHLIRIKGPVSISLRIAKRRTDSGQAIVVANLPAGLKRCRIGRADLCRCIERDNDCCNRNQERGCQKLLHICTTHARVLFPKFRPLERRESLNYSSISPTMQGCALKDVGRRLTVDRVECGGLESSLARLRLSNLRPSRLRQQDERENLYQS